MMKCSRGVGIFLFLNFIAVDANFSEDSNCDNLFKGITKPASCCPIPMPYTKKTSADHCLDDCKNEDGESNKKT